MRAGRKPIPLRTSIGPMHDRRDQIYIGIGVGRPAHMRAWIGPNSLKEEVEDGGYREALSDSGDFRCGVLAGAGASRGSAVGGIGADCSRSEERRVGAES